MSMSTWILELNDSLVRLHRDGETIDASPGVAVIERNQVLTGDAACARLCLDPRAVNDRYWQQLNDLPLPGASRRVRHHADLAYHHLEAIFARTGKPAELAIAPPAHYGDAELSLLLGICAALDLNVVALVDPAVAALAAGAGPGRYQVADLHLHHVTLSRVTVDSEVARSDSDTLDQPGLRRIQTGCVDLIADAFLEQSRFDPLHEAATEQALHDGLGDWLARAADSSQLDITMDYHGSRFTARIPTVELARVVAMVLGPLGEHRDSDARLVLGARFAALPGVAALLPEAVVLPDDAIASGIAGNRLALADDDVSSGIQFTTRLPANTVVTPATTARATPALVSATHVVVDGQAYPLGTTALALFANGAARHGDDPGAAATVRLDGSGATLLSTAAGVRVNDAAVDGERTLMPGDTIAIDDARFLMVRVLDAHAP